MRRRFVALAACPIAVGALAAFVPAGSATTSNAAAVAAAQKVIAPYLKTPTTLGAVTQKLKAIPKGKTVDFLEQPVPIGQEYQVGITHAAAAIGMKATTINAGLTPATMSSAWSQVFQTPPSAVIILGVPANEIVPELQEAKADHIPVVTDFTTNSPYWAADIIGNTQFGLLGKLEANFVIANSDAKAKIADFYEPDLPGAAGITTSFEQTIRSDCAGCQLGTPQTISLEGVGATDPATVVSYMQAHRGDNWLMLPDADDAIGVPSALANAGIHGVKILSGGGSSINYEYIKTGAEYADASQSIYYMGWALIDATARVLAHQSVQIGLIPLEFITKKDLTWNINDPWPSVPSYQKKFENLWGVK
jgi:ribose transport system substrate-binding protein